MDSLAVKGIPRYVMLTEVFKSVIKGWQPITLKSEHLTFVHVIFTGHCQNLMKVVSQMAHNGCPVILHLLTLNSYKSEQAFAPGSYIFCQNKP